MAKITTDNLPLKKTFQKVLRFQNAIYFNFNKNYIKFENFFSIL